MRSFANAEAGNNIIHHDCSCLNSACEFFTSLVITCPNAGCKAELAIVGELNGLFIAVKRHNWQHRAECFFPHDPHFMRDIRKYGWSVEARAEFGQALASKQYFCS